MEGVTSTSHVDSVSSCAMPNSQEKGPVRNSVYEIADVATPSAVIP